MNNAAFIDGANLYQSISDLGWRLDYRKFRRFLKEKYKVEITYLFLGFLETEQAMYTRLQESGYVLVFKPTLKYKDGHTKGNCDADLVLKAMVEFQNYDKAIIVTGDGDFYSLIEYLKHENKLEQVLIPNEFRYSALLKKINESGTKYFSFLNRMKGKLEFTKTQK
jgi:uncharacterized LabA/DUF88 family protein